MKVVSVLEKNLDRQERAGHLFFAVSTALISTEPLVPGSFTYSNFGGVVLVGVGVGVVLDFSISDEEDTVDPRLPEKASVSMRGRNRDLDGVWGFCDRVGVGRAGIKGWLAGDSLRKDEFVGVGLDCERLKVRREVGVAGGDGEAAPVSLENVLVSPWKTFITDHLLRP